MKKSIVIFEAEGGSDKWINGHRKDTLPIVEAIKNHGWHAEVVFFRDEWKDFIIDYASTNFDAYISRINPGTLPEGEASYFEALDQFIDAGLFPMSSPTAMLNFGAKNVLAKLADTPLVPGDTFAYYDVATFKDCFPHSLTLGERVLKQNRGSAGEGIWRVSLDAPFTFSPHDKVPVDATVKCTEAVDNHIEYHKLADFMEFCTQYIEGDNGMLVDMRFLPRIVEGEIRILMVGNNPMFVVKKKPVQDESSFSATLFSGAKYSYHQPSEFQELIGLFHENLPLVSDKLGGLPTPLIWTADFMLDNDPLGRDKYILGEINCSCVGFTSHLNHGIQEAIAAEAIRRIKKHYGLLADDSIADELADPIM